MTLFQYISCYSLSHCFILFFSYSIVSIHLMLLFIRFFRNRWHHFRMVSIHLMLLFIQNQTGPRASPLCFNTSHVTLYQSDEESLLQVKSFQYISCYSLSCCLNLCIYIFKVSIHLMLLFIDKISVFHFILLFVSIHLMLLFIFCHVLKNISPERFNTSHVTLYPSFYRLFFF